MTQPFQWYTKMTFAGGNQIYYISFYLCSKTVYYLFFDRNDSLYLLTTYS